jgi:DNA-binding beta-propeller fold protein YncE
VYLTGQGEGVLQAFDVATHQVVAKVPVGADPTSAAVSADGRFAYTSGGPTGDHVQIVDTATNKVAADLDVGAAVNEIVVRGDTLIVGTGKGVALLDAATGQRRGEVDATGYLGAVSPDGRTAYLFTDRAGQFVKLDLPGRRIVNTVQLDGIETPVGFSADGASAYFRVESPLSIAVVDVGTNRVTRSVALPAAVSNAAAVSPDGRLVYFRGPGLAAVVVVRVA